MTRNRSSTTVKTITLADMAELVSPSAERTGRQLRTEREKHDSVIHDMVYSPHHHSVIFAFLHILVFVVLIIILGCGYILRHAQFAVFKLSCDQLATTGKKLQTNV